MHIRKDVPALRCIIFVDRYIVKLVVLKKSFDSSNVCTGINKTCDAADILTLIADVQI